MRTVLGIVFSVVIGGAVLAAPGGAQDEMFPSDETLREHQRLAQAMIQGDIVPRLRAALSAQERDALGSTRVAAVFDRNPYRIGVARVQGGPSTIEMGAAFLHATDVASDATAVAAHRSRFRDLVGYAQRYVGSLRASWRAPSQSAQAVPSATFADYIGWSRLEYDAYRTTRAYQSMRVELNRQSVAWVTAHYVGHEILADTAGESLSRDRERYERTIDAFATRLTFDAGFAPMPPLASAMLFVSFEDRTLASPGAALCRAVEIAWRGWQLSATDPAAAQRFGASTFAARYVASQREELERLRSGSLCAALPA